MAETNGHLNGVSNGVSNGIANSHSSTPERPLQCGIYAPIMTFYNEDETVDYPSLHKHIIRLAESGLVGIVIGGSNGELVHLSHSELLDIIKYCRKGLDEAGFRDFHIIAGATQGSVRGTIALIQECKDAGADSVLILPPSYFRGLMDEESIYNYFWDVADKSALPIILYNYPGAVAGIDMDSDFLIKLAKHPKIAGTKFTCGNTGKLTRVALATNATTPDSAGSGYFAFGGMCDFTTQTAMSGGSGIIAGGANVMPRVCVEVWNLYAEGKVKESIALQKILSKDDWVLTKAAIAGTKSAIQSYWKYGGHPRRPLKRLDEVGVKSIKEGISEVMKIELELQKRDTGK